MIRPWKQAWVAGQIVDLHKIEAPRRPLICDRVVIFLSTRPRDVDTVHVVIPAAHTCGIGDVMSMERGAKNRRVLVVRGSGNSAHEMNPELQTFAVHVVGQRLKSKSPA